MLEATRARALTEDLLRLPAHAATLTRFAASTFLVAGRAALFVLPEGGAAIGPGDRIADSSFQPREKRPSYGEVDGRGRRPREKRRSFNLEDAALSPASAARDLGLVALAGAAAKSLALASIVLEDTVLAIPIVDGKFRGALALTRFGGKALDAADARTIGAVEGLADGLRAAARHCVPEARSVYDDPRLPRLSAERVSGEFDRGGQLAPAPAPH